MEVRPPSVLGRHDLPPEVALPLTLITAEFTSLVKEPAMVSHGSQCASTFWVTQL